ncbi:MAG: hypothetical protein HYY65_09560 [Candidatus Tectomicrobia bacterium]|uniref:Uncharacterized protein n=1 Tax=Tectimicrobiota bacterium TaxID=2528274 RepID=A0A932GR02_UNCTE|nr:hypothetical protein [Candidatus Tectomicrobia bacterium]
MTTSQNTPRHVHLVGSVNLSTVQEVFETAGSILGDRLQRLPDGEPGPRRGWISYQYALFRVHPDLEVTETEKGQHPGALTPVRLRPGVKPEELKFPELGYSREARISYFDFKRAKEAGKIPVRCRFQVSLPTPVAPIHAYVTLADQLKVEPAYEQAMMAEVERILAAIPHNELAMQWDVCREMVIYDGRLFKSPWQNPEDEIVKRLARISKPIPDDVQLGFHLCYGDLNKKHFIEPEDSGKMVALANAISAAVKRPIAWIHMPVPKDRSDEAYFAPLKNLKLHPETELVLGLVHNTDGVQGTRKRIAAAQKVVSDFAVATECGIGRSYASKDVPDLFKIHAAVTQPA